MKKIKKLSLKKEVIASLSQKEQHVALGGVVGSQGCDTGTVIVGGSLNDPTACTHCFYCPIEIAPIITNPPINTVIASCQSIGIVCQTNAVLCTL